MTVFPRALSRRQILWSHFPALLHLCACIAFRLLHLESAWGYMFWIDAPASVLILALSYNHDRPLFLFGTIGTLWWYLLGFAVVSLWARALRRGPGSSKLE